MPGSRRQSPKSRPTAFGRKLPACEIKSRMRLVFADLSNVLHRVLVKFSDPEVLWLQRELVGVGVRRAGEQRQLPLASYPRSCLPPRLPVSPPAHPSACPAICPTRLPICLQPPGRPTALPPGLPRQLRPEPFRLPASPPRLASPGVLASPHRPIKANPLRPGCRAVRLAPWLTCLARLPGCPAVWGLFA